MDVLIIAKWNHPLSATPLYNDINSAAEHARFENHHKAPAIITTVINIYLNGAEVDEKIAYSVLPG